MVGRYPIPRKDLQVDWAGRFRTATQRAPESIACGCHRGFVAAEPRAATVPVHSGSEVTIKRNRHVPRKRSYRDYVR